jgi:beta-exotoxin I transport system permease protein
MLSALFAKTLRDLRWQVLWYGLGLGVLAATSVALYPSVKEQLADFDIPAALEGLVGDNPLSSPQGYLSARFFSWSVLIMAMFAVMAGTSALAGEEANGTADLLMSCPLERSRIVLEKAAAILVAILTICAVTSVGWLVSVPPVEIDIPLGDLLVATFNMAPITLLYVLVAMWAGATLPNRRVATGIATAAVIVAFFVNYFAGTVDALEPLGWLSPFFYYDGENVLSEGVAPWRVGVLLAASVTFFAAALYSFERRDIGTYAQITLRLRRPHREEPSHEAVPSSP